MALFSRSLLARSNQAFASILARSFSSSSLSGSAVRSLSLSTLLLHRLRPLAAASTELRLRLAASTGPRGFATRSTTSSLSDPNPNWSNRPPKETILLDGCDFEHWLVVMEKPEGDPTRDEIIDSYIKTLAAVVGSEEDARMKIYSVSTRYYFAFGALVPEEVSFKLKELPRVRWVLPDSYLDVRNKDYGGEPFLNGQAVPYDSKFHEEWVRNNARANERNRRSDRPRNFDRSRSFERRRENVNNNQSSYQAGPTPNNQGAMPPEQGFQTGPPPNNMAVPPPNRNYPPPNQSYLGGNVPPPNQNYHQGQNMQYNQGGSPPPYNRGGAPPYNNGGTPPQYNQGGAPPQYNQGGVPPQYNQGGVPPQYNNMGGVPPQYNNMGGMLPQNNTGGVPTQNMNQGPSSENYTPSRDPAAVPNGEL